MKFKLFILLSSLLLLVCKREEKKIDDFSSGLANRDTSIADGIRYIQEGKAREAIKFFEDLGKRNPRHCGYLIGVPLAQIQKYIASLNSIINFVSSAYSGISGSTPLAKMKQSSYCDPSLDGIIRDFLRSLYADTKNGLELVERALQQNCEMDIRYPIRLSVGPNFSLYILLAGKIGDVELELLRYVGYLVLTISAVLISHDFSINTPDILSSLSKIDGSNVIGLIRTLAFSVAGCDQTFLFHSEDKKYIFDIPSHIVSSSESVTNFLKNLEARNNSEEYAIFFKDNSGEGKLGYYPEQTTPELLLDEITINVQGEVSVSTFKAKLNALKIKIPYIITTDFLEKSLSVLERIRNIVNSKGTGCPANCISVSEVNFIFQALGSEGLPDFLRIDINRYFQNPKSFRELIPYWFYNQEKERWEFMLEAEVPPSRKDIKYYLFNYDSAHFEKPISINFYGEIITDFSIPPDCIFMKDVPLDWLVSPYILFQDPTIAGTFYVRLKGVPLEFCSLYENIYDTEEWKEANQYMANKAIAVITAKAGSVISPLTDILLNSIEIIR